jgi:hypothetical protein
LPWLSGDPPIAILPAHGGPSISVPIYVVDLFIPVGALAICLVLISELLQFFTKTKKEH